MKNLISMTDFVLEQNKKGRVYYDDLWNIVINYAKFLKQPPQQWMLVPCDEDGNVLEEPHREDYDMYDDTVFLIDIQKYQQAKEKCLFEGFSEIDANFVLFANKTIEDLVQYNLRLTPTALKQIGL